MISDSVAAQFSSGSLWLALVGLALATLLSEDLTCIGAGLLVASGKAPFWPVLAACMIGIFMGDILLVAIGRTLGRPMLEMRLVRTRVSPERIERAEKWFKSRGGRLVLATRFMPGIRLPAYLAAGILRVPWPPFIGWFALGCLIWTPLLVGGTVWAGARLLDLLHAWERTVPMLAAAGLLIWIFLKLAIRLSSWRGRRILLSRWLRLTRWANWPRWAKYLPVAIHVLALGLWHRRLTAFAAVNAGMKRTPSTGCESDCFRLLSHAGVVQTHDTLNTFDILYCRSHGGKRGHAIAITEWHPLAVTGDGVHSLEELILASDETIHLAEGLLKASSARLDDIPVPGESVSLAMPCGTRYREVLSEACEVVTPQMMSAIEAISHAIPGFQFGNIRVRADGKGAFLRGEIAVVAIGPGLSAWPRLAESRQSVWQGWRLQWSLWNRAFQIGTENIRLGAPVPTLQQAWHAIWSVSRLNRPRSAANASEPEIPSGGGEVECEDQKSAEI